MSDRVLRRAKMAISRPDLLLRKLRGKEIIGIDLDEIARYVGETPVIVEAGALNGDDTARFAARWPAAAIHAFEPVPEAFERVRERTAHLPQVRRYELALSTSTGEAVMHVSVDALGGSRPDSSSLLEPTELMAALPEVTFARDVTVKTIRLAEWCESEGVTRIDLLWLDLQGMELPVLKASPEALRNAGAVVMEVSRRELYVGSGDYDDAVTWMREHGFRVAIDRVTTYFGNVLFVRV